MDDLSRPISERAQECIDRLKDGGYLKTEDGYLSDDIRGEIAAVVQQSLDESFEDGISEYITRTPPKDGRPA